MTGGDKQYQMLSEFDDIKIGKTAISKEKFLMCIRPSMRNYLSKLYEICSFEDGILFYGMWKGYLEQEDMKEFVDFMKSMGVKLHILHTSGHADEMTVENLIKDISPKTIIPVHTENAKWFSKYEDVQIVFDCKNYCL
jgi:ribonuclease J